MSIRLYNTIALKITKWLVTIITLTCMRAYTTDLSITLAPGESKSYSNFYMGSIFSMFPTFHYSVHAPSGISFNNSGMYTQGPDIRNQYSILAWFTVLVSSDMLAGQYSVVVTYNFYSGPVPILTNLLTFNVTVPFQAPVIIQQPQNLTNEYGSAAAFRVKATGEPLMYQWRFNGSNLEGATNLSYAIPSVNTNHSGLYSVVVSNVLGSVISSDAMLVVIINPPVITQQPQSLTNQYGGAATFSVKTTGTEPLTYQWLFNGADLIGATNISCFLPRNCGCFMIGTKAVTERFSPWERD